MNFLYFLFYYSLSSKQVTWKDAMINNKCEGGVQHGPSIQNDMEQNMRKESQEQVTVRLKKPLSEIKTVI